MPTRALPQVVEFDHKYSVRISSTSHKSTVVAMPAGNTPLKRMRDLPFVGECVTGQWSWWCYPQASNVEEAELRGKFFWEEFVRYTRGHQKRRRFDALCLLTYALHDMPGYRRGSDEADVFMRCLAEAVIAHLRVGLNEGKAS